MEGLAEYSAFSYMMKRCDPGIAQDMLETNYNALTACEGSESVMDTMPGSPDFSANKGIKPAWIYYSAGEKFGFEKGDGFFRDLYQEYSGVGEISGDEYLSRLSDAVGSEAYEHIFEYHSKPGWTMDDVRYLYSLLTANCRTS